METSSNVQGVLRYSHPLGLEINEKGICSGCLIHEERLFRLGSKMEWFACLVKDYKCKQKVKYDCIVPVLSKWLLFHSSYIKNKLNLNPLVVTYNKYFNTPLELKI